MQNTFSHQFPEKKKRKKKMAQKKIKKSFRIPEKKKSGINVFINIDD